MAHKPAPLDPALVEEFAAAFGKAPTLTQEGRLAEWAGVERPTATLPAVTRYPGGIYWSYDQEGRKFSLFQMRGPRKGRR